MESRTCEIDGTALHVGVTGRGPDVVVLSGGPGCVQYLESDAIAPPDHRAWYPEPRGVGRSQGGPHTMEQAIADLEGIRRAVGVERWIVVGHSWGGDLAVRYGIEHPDAVTAVIGIAGRGFQRDVVWSEQYAAAQPGEPEVEIEGKPDVHAALSASFTEWVHQPDLWRRVAECPVPIHLIAAGDDIRPAWPLQQLASLAPLGAFSTVPGVPHDFWALVPDRWVSTLSGALAELRGGASAGDGRGESAGERAKPRLIRSEP